eukprot:Nk52_evm8s274 gene=Nk52_evmTU8s274
MQSYAGSYVLLELSAIIRILREEDLVPVEPGLSNRERERWEEMRQKWGVNDDTLKSIFESIMTLMESSIKGLYAEYIWCWVRKKLWTRDVKKKAWKENLIDHERGIHCPLCRQNEIETVEHINACRGYLELANAANRSHKLTLFEHLMSNTKNTTIAFLVGWKARNAFFHAEEEADRNINMEALRAQVLWEADKGNEKRRRHRSRRLRPQR